MLAEVGNYEIPILNLQTSIIPFLFICKLAIIMLTYLLSYYEYSYWFIYSLLKKDHSDLLSLRQFPILEYSKDAGIVPDFYNFMKAMSIVSLGILPMFVIFLSINKILKLNHIILDVIFGYF